MKKENGFTLVELLAVIGILAIILIIAVPGVLSIINKTKNSAYDRQIDMIKEASRLYITSDNDVTWVGQDTKMTTVSLDVLKTKGYLDQKILDPKTKQEITCAKTTITKNGSKYGYDVTLCDQVNRSPRLSSNMIPIVYDGTKWIKADYTNQKNAWYDYENQQWANMATVTESSRDAYKKADIGTEVKMDDINAMFVWIPRFKYKLFNVDGTISPVGNPNMAGDYMIDVQLEDINTPKSKGSQNGEWLTHPAFTFGGQELEGFWIAKFETGYLGATTLEEAQRDITDATKIVIKPNQYSWRNINIKNGYYNALQMNISENEFGLNKTDDSHLAKNTEWGAMAYLSYSVYGKAGNKTYIGTEKEVFPNGNNQYLTGCGSPTHDSKNLEICHTYETTNGMKASTTGNISGIYDTSGGSWEYVAAVREDSSRTHILNQSSGFSVDELDKVGYGGKYFDIYSDNATGVDTRILGDASIEMEPANSNQLSWYEDSYQLKNSGDNAWTVRGYHWSSGELAGILANGITYGQNAVSWGYRISLI